MAKRQSSFTVPSSEVSRSVDNSTFDIIKLINDNLDDVVTAGENIVDITTVAGIAPQVSDVAAVADKIPAVVSMSTEISSLYNDKVALDNISLNLTEILDADEQAANALTSANSASTSETNAQLITWKAEASKMTADSSAVEANGVLTKVYTSNGDGTFAATDTTGYSALHWKTVAETGRVPQTAYTGSAEIPLGTIAERDVTPTLGFFRFNTDYSKFEGYNGSTWGTVGGGATGGGNDEIFIENGQTVTADYTIPTGKNAISIGPITVQTDVVVTISSGSVWRIL